MVPLHAGKMKYRFAEWDNEICYDAFFEREKMVIDRYKGSKVVLDLYGNKKTFEGDILISTASRPYKVIETLKLKYRPQENNCVYAEQGEGIFVYDLKVQAPAPESFGKEIRLRYDTKCISWKNLLRLGFVGLKNAVKSRLKK